MAKKPIIPKNAKPVGKKKTVPESLDWGPNAPRDHLAYLNKREMEYLQQLRNFKGRREYNGVPAFPDPGDTGKGDKGQGTSSSHGSSATSGGSSGGSKGPGGPNGPNSGPSGGSGGLGGGNKGGGPGGPSGPNSGSSATGGGNKGNSGAGTSSQKGSGGMRGAGSNTGPGSARPGSVSTGGDGFKAPSGQVGKSRDEGIKESIAQRDSIRVARESAPYQGDAAKPTNIKDQIKNSIVGPQRVSGMPPHAAAAAAEAFYKSDPYTQDAIAKLKDDAALSNMGIGDIATGFAKTLENSPLNLKNAAQGIASLATNTYNDPLGTATEIAKSVYDNTVGTFNSYAFGDKPMFDSYGNVTPQAARDITNLAANVGLGSSVASAATGVPKDALGSLAVGRSSVDPAIQKMFEARDVAVKKGATAEEAFNESLKHAPSYAGGVVDVVSSIPKSPNESVRYAQAVEIAEPFAVKSSGLAQDAIESVLGKGPIEGVKRYSDVFKEGPINKSYPSVGDMPVYRDPTVPKGVQGYYQPKSSISDYLNTVATPGERYNALKYGSTAYNVPVKQDWAEKIANWKNPDPFRGLAAHEGLHRVADYEARYGIKDPIPQGTNDQYQESLIRDSLNRSNNTMSNKQISDMAWNRYKYSPGEVYARMAAARLEALRRDMQNYDTRFGRLSDEELQGMSAFGTEFPW